MRWTIYQREYTSLADIRDRIAEIDQARTPAARSPSP